MFDRHYDPAIVVPDRDDVDTRDRVEITLAMHVPVTDAVGAGHHDRMLRELRHLVAHEDLSEEDFFGGLGFFDQVGKVGGRGGHWMGSFVIVNSVASRHGHERETI